MLMVKKSKTDKIIELLEQINKRLDNFDEQFDGLRQEIMRIQEQIKTKTQPSKPKWTKFKSGNGEWAFSNSFPELTRELKTKNARGSNYLVKDGFRYRLSGDEDRFIQRYPIKKKGEK